MNNDKNNHRVGKSTHEMKSLLHNQTSKIEENMAHAFSLLSPLKSENVELKNKILATQTYLEQQREKLSDIVRETESRQLIKRISDFPTLISILQQDMQQLEQTMKIQTEKLQKQEELIIILSEERNKNYERIIQEVSQKEQVQAETIMRQEETLQQKNEIISKLQNLVEDENIKIKKNQNSHYEILDSYNEKLDELTEQLNDEIEKQAQIKDKYTQMIQQMQNDHQTQVAIKQDQYEFALGELRNSYEKRMEKLIKDSEFRISEANKTCIRANKELEQVRTKYEQEIQKNEQQMNFIKNLQIQLQQAQQQAQTYRNQMQQQQLYLHQTQALVNSLKKSSLLSSSNKNDNAELQLEERELNIALENFNLQMQSIGNQTTDEKHNQDFEDQFQQTSPHLIAQNNESPRFSPSEFKLNLKNVENETTQHSPRSNNKTADEKLSYLNLDDEQNQIKRLNLLKKLKKKRSQRSKNRDEFYLRINELQNNQVYGFRGFSPKCSEETPSSKPKKLNFTNAFSIQNNLSSRRRSYLQQYSQAHKIQSEQHSQFQIQTSDEICQTDQVLNEYEKLTDKLDQQNNQTQELSNNIINSNFFTPVRLRQNSNFLENGSNFDGNELNQYQGTTDQESTQLTSLMKGEIKILKDRISILQSQNSQQAKNISELQEKAEKMQNNFKKNLKEMKIQIQRSTNENTNLLKQIERPKEGAKKKIELQKHLENQISISDNLQSQLQKASEIIRYFNQELENYKQLYNIFGQGSKSERLQNTRLPSLRKPKYKNKSYQKTQIQQSSMYEEAQKLIENLYDNKIIFTKFN